MKRRNFMKSIGLTTTFPFIGCSALSLEDKYGSNKPSGIITKRTLGKTGIEVSMLGFGAHLKKGLIKNPKLRDKMIKIGYEGGINIFDVYNRSEYKQYIPMSESIREFRQNIILSLYSIYGTEKIQENIDYSLKVFKTDYIDLYRFRPEDDKGVSIMEKNKKEGKIRAIGIASHDAGELLGKINLYGKSIDYVLIVYNFHYNKREPTKNALPNDLSMLIPVCRQLNLGIIGIKPMGSDRLIDIAYKKGFFKDKKINIAQSMLRYAYANTEIDTVLTAMNSMEEVIKDIESAYNPTIYQYEIDKLKELSSLALSLEKA